MAVAYLLGAGAASSALISATLQDGPLSDLAVVSQIHGEYAETRLIVLIDRSEPDLVVQAFRAGATASRWSLEGADLVYRSGEMHVLVECKPFRQTVAKNLAAFRWGGGLAFRCIMSHHCFERVFPNK